MPRPNQPHRKKTSHDAHPASPAPAGPGPKKKSGASPPSAKAPKPIKLAKSLLLQLAKQIAKQKAAPGAPATPAASKAQTPVPPAPPVNGAPSPHLQPIAETRVNEPGPFPGPRRAPAGGAYHTNYLIEVYGSLKPDGSQLLIIEGRTPIKIDWLQFLLLLILASHARSKAGLDSPMDLRGGDFLPPARIELIITQLMEGTLSCAGRRFPKCLNAYDADLIRNAKYDLRLRLRRHRKRPDLLDRGGGTGYRISTPPGRIKITLLIDGADDVVFDWHE
jgi:hypothetical protein